MQVIKIKIITDPQLNEPLGDFLVGVMNMVVEFKVEEPQTASSINGFFAQDYISEHDQDAIKAKISSFADEMSEIFGCKAPVVSIKAIPDQDWSQKWKQFFKPFELVPGLIVVPSWESFSPVEDQQVIIMDPGMAFGTGHHATTKLCLQLMKDSEKKFKNRPVLDVGTGTGILAMAAVLWGASEALAIDNDPEAVRVATENTIKNKLDDRVEISGTGLEEIKYQFPLVVANIIHDTLVFLAESLSKTVEKSGILILSGLVHGTQTDNIIRCFEAGSFQLTSTIREGEWGALKFIKSR